MIRNGETKAPIVAGGQTYTPEMIAGMVERGEYANTAGLADAWAQERGDLSTLRDFRYNRDEFLARHPGFAETQTLDDVAEGYKGGKPAFIAATRAANPSYDAYVAGLVADGKTGADLEKAALNLDGYAAAQGWQRDVWDTIPPATRPVVAGGQTVSDSAAAYRRTRAEQATERVAPDLAAYGEMAALARQVLPGVPLPEAIPQVSGSRLPDSLYHAAMAQARAELGYGPYGRLPDADYQAVKDRINDQRWLSDDAAAYQKWAANRPGATPVAWAQSPEYRRHQRDRAVWFDPAGYLAAPPPAS